MQWHMQWHILSTLFCPGKSYTVCYDICNDLCRWHMLMIYSHDTSSWRIWWHMHWWHMLMTCLLSKKGYVIVFGPICPHGVELKQYVIAYVIGGGVINACHYMCHCICHFVLWCVTCRPNDTWRLHVPMTHQFLTCHQKCTWWHMGICHYYMSLNIFLYRWCTCNDYHSFHVLIC